MGLVPLFATILPAGVAGGFILSGSFHVAAPLWVLFDGAVMIPLAFWCLATGPRYLSGPEVGMFYLLETILAPVWVWMVFGEVPTPQALTGGSLLVLALVGYSVFQIWRGGRDSTPAS
jgi:drug/metabolite transporter (DMT)-like permease